MTPIDFDFAKLSETIKSEALLVSGVMREKGVQPFSRTLAVAALALLLSAMVYNHPIGRRRGLEKRLQAAKATSEYADQYKEVHDQLRRLYRQLPLLKDRDQFLLNALVDSLKAENITPDALKPPAEDEQGNLIYQNVSMSSSLKFAEFVSWLSRIESAKPTMLVTQVGFTKKPEPIGTNSVACVIHTIIPKGRY